MVSAKKRVYKEKDLKRKKEKIGNLNVQTAKNFFEGKFYSSDEDDESKTPDQTKGGDMQKVEVGKLDKSNFIFQKEI